MLIFKDILAAHNLHWTSIETYALQDKNLRDLRNCRYVLEPDWFSAVSNPGVHVIYGGRQIGKTTGLKTHILRQLESSTVESQHALYVPCDILIDKDQLREVLREYAQSLPTTGRSLLVLDEVTFLKGWEVAFKSVIDEGRLSQTTIVITGSDRIVLEDSAAGFPGVERRGKGGHNLLLLPLHFGQFVQLVASHLTKTPLESNRESLEELSALFEQYLQCGGFLSAINNRDSNFQVERSAIAVYQQWLLSDFIRKGRDKHRLLELLKIVYERLGSQVSYNALASAALNLSTPLVIDYLDHLERLGVIVSLKAFDQNSLSFFPKKDKKIHFRDPLVVQVVYQLLLKEQLISERAAPDSAYLSECAVVAAFADRYPLHYIKAEGEVDLVVVEKGTFLPIEVKWSERLRENELKQILKYSQGIIVSKNQNPGTFRNIPCYYLPWYLFQKHAEPAHVLC